LARRSEISLVGSISRVWEASGAFVQLERVDREAGAWPLSAA
jgi:hypothetical protein